MPLKFIATVTLALLTFSAHAESLDTQKTDEGLTAEFVYKYLVGEIAGQRGEVGLASSVMLDLAKSSQNPFLAERATRAAIYGNIGSLALDSAKLWSTLDPDSKEARQTLIQLLIASDNLQDLRAPMDKILAEESDRGSALMYLSTLFSKSKDKNAVLKLVESITQPYLELPEAHFALAHAALNTKDDARASQELSKATEISPGWEPAALLEGQLEQRKSPKHALDFYEKYLDTYPLANEVRLAYARLLVSEREIGPARQQFDKLTEIAPDNPEIHTIIGLLAVQVNDFSTAELHFTKALNLNYKDADQLELYLGQTSEQLNKTEEAFQWYSKVNPESNLYLDAQIRSANLMAKKGNLEKAINHLHGLTEITSEQKALVNQAEVNLLISANREKEAYDLMRNTIETLPNTPELIYDYAMLAERVKQYDVMEKELRKLIILKPDMGHAYNALGYSFADRNIKLDEAQKLIQKALELNPDDFFILDSMGWVNYRQGKLDKSLELLKRAYAANADPEVAAHLGEVLWKSGQREEASKTWAEALRAHPDNETLQKTSKKFLP